MIGITGYSGFVGASLTQKFINTGSQIVMLGRQPNTDREFYPLNLASTFDCTHALADIDVLIHCAACTHIMQAQASDPLSAYQQVNTQGTLNLATQAAKVGVKRFIFLSSIGVNGLVSVDPFTESHCLSPHNDYAVSKYQAEQGLLNIAHETDMEIVIIRPPVVYGSGVKGSFASLIQLVKKSIPLPLASVTDNKRSLLALDNLIDFILLCADATKSPQAANQTFVLADGEDVSTAELLQRISQAYGKKSHLFPVPLSLLRLGAKLAGKQTLAKRLLGSLQIDSSKARALLGWKPVITMDEQLRKMAAMDND